MIALCIETACTSRLFVAVALMWAAAGCDAPSAAQQEQRKQHERDARRELEQLRTEVAGVFEGTCNDQRAIACDDGFECGACKTSQGEVEYRRHPKVKGAVAVKLPVTIAMSELAEQLANTHCDDTSQRWYRFEDGPLKGKLIMAAWRSSSTVYAQEFFSASVSHRFSPLQVSCLMAFGAGSH